MKSIHHLIILLLTIPLFSCNSSSNKSETNDKLRIVTTTTMITDMVTELGGDAVNVQGLMGAGVDPHLYKASEGDVNKLFNADMVIYGGLHLEGKLVEVFEKMESQGISMVAVSDTIPLSSLISSANFASNYDPHIWFDISLWKKASAYVAQKLIKTDPIHQELYTSNLDQYLSRLDSTEMKIKEMINTLPPENRVLITAHDAFNYFGKAYGFEVLGLQGISTATEAGVQDVQNLASVIVERKIKAIFIESSVPKRNIEALQASVKSKGFEVAIGGELYSDACGDAGTVEGTYIGMVLHNVSTITNALK
jgi:manganese/zinc/iron transport system substrate-binding protein